MGLALVTLLHIVLVVRDASGPLVAAGDANYYEFLGYYVRDHVRFVPVPWLHFTTDELGYPYGVDSVFLSWCAERDLLHAGLLSLFGPGPWLQLYFGFGDVIGVFGVYYVLRREFGVRSAALVAFAATIMGFYTAFKFPLHHNLSAAHWGLLSIALDFVIVRHVLMRRRMTALLVLMRVALIGLCVGLDAAYVAGFPLLSFTMTTLFLGGWLVREHLAGRSALGAILPRDVYAEMKARPLAFTGWFVLLAIACLLYVPFDLAVLVGSMAHPYTGAGGCFWAQWLRLLLPYLPGLHPNSELARSIFGEADGVGEFSIGWALLGAAIVGLRDAYRKKRLATFAPLIATFLLCFAFHPKRLPTLHLFPWFMYNRVAGRATIYFPLFAALMALGFDKEASRSRLRRWVALFLPLAVIETATAYALASPYRPEKFTPSMDAYMTTVRHAPGTALLQWPLCIAGADGVGTEELCPYYRRIASAWSFRRFHGKKVPNVYLSRLSPSAIQPWIDGGWPAMFSPDAPDTDHATRQTRCFDERGWDTFTTFYRSGDFAGIELYTDIEAPECVTEFHARFGEPAAETVLPGIGRVQFLPRRQQRAERDGDNPPSH